MPAIRLDAGPKTDLERIARTANRPALRVPNRAVRASAEQRRAVRDLTGAGVKATAH